MRIFSEENHEFSLPIEVFFFIFYLLEEGGHFNCCCPQQVSRDFFFVLIYGVSHGKEFCAVKGEIAHTSIQNGEGIRDGHSLLCCKLLT